MLSRRVLRWTVSFSASGCPRPRTLGGTPSLPTLLVVTRFQMATQRYLVTARKYRPQLFEELVAQEHVTETLKNAIRLDRLAHAYLFSGPRGVGKTTAARILAKAINCTTPMEDREGSAEPCRTCDSCRTFEEGRSLNIIEIDAASNNRVDDIRDLRETVRIPPQGGRKKVYIVDEVHMLSTAAFNALLKTLEEPPPHVLFIFATTEPHKVLPTILSRCQRFDFRRISVPEIVSRLRNICREEEITADDASLMLVARKGDGALRDALSVFDQAVSLCGSDLQYADLAHALGVVDIDLYFDVTGFVGERSAAGMLRLVDRIVRSGYDLQEFLTGLAEHLRNLLVARAMTDTSLIEAAEPTRERYAAAATAFSEVDLLRLLTLVSDAEESIKNSPQPRLRLETALLKMATITLAADLRQAIDKIDRLEKLAREGKIPSDIGNGSESKTSGSTPSGKGSRNSSGSSGDGGRGSSGGGSGKGSGGGSGSGSGGGSGSGSGSGGSGSGAAANSGAAADSGAAAGGGAVADSGAAAEGGAATGGRGDGSGSSSTHRASSTSATGPAAAHQSEAPDRVQPASDEPAQAAGPHLTSEPAATLYSAKRDSLSAAEPGSVRQGSASDSAQETSTPRTQSDRPIGGNSPRPGKDIFGKPALKRKNPPATNAAPSAGKDEVEAAVADAPNALPLAQIWDDLVETVNEDRIHVGSLLKHSRPEDVRDGIAVIGVPDDFHHRLLSHQHDYLIEHIKPLLSVEIRSMRFMIREDLEAPDAEETASDFDPYEYMQRKRQENPVIRAIFDQFGGELVW